MKNELSLISFQFGEWTIEPSLNRIVRGESSVHVEPRTLAVLVCLLDRPGQLVSIDAILEAVWAGRIVEPNAVQRHIARIRRLLGDHARNPEYVETISKQGYRAIAPVRRKEYVAVDGMQPSLRTADRQNESAFISARLPRSIAVLPLADLSPDPDHGYFAAGIHEEILNQLAKITDLSVIARTTMTQYSKTALSIPEIASELKVQTVLEGGVRYSGRRVRVTVQLVDGLTGAHLWSEAYEENLEDILEVQLAIAARIAGSMNAQFPSQERHRMRRRSTDSAEAYRLYLLALSKWGNLAATGPVHDALDAAILADPAFAAPLAFKAWIRSVEAGYGSLFGIERFGVEDQERLIGEADQLARRALALDEDETLARLALSTVFLHDHRWKAARENFERIPSNGSEYFALAYAGCSAWRDRGDVDSAIRLMERSIELNPADGANVWNFGVILYWAKQWRAAVRQAESVVQMLPELPLGYGLHALASSRAGEPADVYRYAKLAEARQPGLTDLSTIARAYGQVGDRREARRVFESVGADTEGQTPEWQFWMHMAVNDYETAMRHLDHAVSTNFPQNFVFDLHYESAHPDFDPIRTHPGFDDLVGRASAPVV
ncbi:MAG: winged helix-turn-helix domain-containing protein [Pseudomonadales bacterium]